MDLPKLNVYKLAKANESLKRAQLELDLITTLGSVEGNAIIKQIDNYIQAVRIKERALAVYRNS